MRNLSAMTHVLIFGASLFVFSHNVQAKACYEKSSNFLIHQEDYYNLDKAVKLTSDDKEKIEAIQKRMQGKWSGSLKKTDCKGPDRSPRKDIKNRNVAASISTAGNGSLVVSADITDVAEKIMHHENISLLDPTYIFSIDFKGKNSLVFSEKYRKNNVTGGTRLIEYIYQINVTDNTLTMMVYYYTNTVFVSVDEWALHKE